MEKKLDHDANHDHDTKLTKDMMCGREVSFYVENFNAGQYYERWTLGDKKLLPCWSGLD